MPHPELALSAPDFDFTAGAISLDELFTLDVAAPRRLFGPFTDPSITLLHAPVGVGKTLFAHEIALAIASGRSRFRGQPPGWECRGVPRPVLLVDGEMPLASLKSRLLSMKAGRSGRVNLISNARLADLNMPMVDIASGFGREELDKHMASIEGLGLIVLDNLTTLTGSGFNEDDSSDQRPINRWMLKLRERGISVLMVHHDNKNRDQRGSSDRTSVCDLVIHLIRADFTPITEARFNVLFTKSRFIDSAPVDFEAYYNGVDWECRDDNASRVDELITLMKITDSWDWRALAQELGVSRSRVYALRTQAIEAGKWRLGWKIPKRYVKSQEEGSCDSPSK